MTIERVQDRTEEFLGRMMGALADFTWKTNEVKRLERKIYGTGQKVSYGVAQYGIEMVMPKGTSGKSLSEMDDMDEREKREIERYVKMKAEIDMLDRIAIMDCVSNDIQLATIYDLALAGMSVRGIAKHMCSDRATVTKQIEGAFIAAMQDEVIETWLIYGVVDTFE